MKAKGMGTISSTALGIAMIAVFLLAAGGIRLIQRGEHRQQGWLMIVAAMVLLGNVLIWTV
ncbi:MAG TPA: hypothetical protein VJ763_04345 [Sphingomicrobium sp.]|nr:hypothetical protein [Sphingomicrobium sp.]